MFIFFFFFFFFFFFNDTATTEIYTLSLHDALPICEGRLPRGLLLAGRRRPGPVSPRSRPSRRAARVHPRRDAPLPAEARSGRAVLPAGHPLREPRLDRGRSRAPPGREHASRRVE